MPLVANKISIPLSGSVQDKIDDKLLPVGKLSTLENAVFNKYERIDKRNGFDKITNESIPYSKTISDFTALLNCKKELLGIAKNVDANVEGSNSLHSYSPAANKWIYKDRFSTTLVESKQIKKGIYSLQNCDVAYSNGLACIAWESSIGGVYATIYDTQTESILLDNIEMSSTGVRPKVVANDKYFYVYYYVSSSTSLYVRKSSVVSPESFDTAALVSSTVYYRYNFCKHGNVFGIVYEGSSGGLYVGYINVNGLIASSVEGFPSPVLVPSTTGLHTSAVSIFSTYDIDPLTGHLMVTYRALGGATDYIRVTIYYFNLVVRRTQSIDSISMTPATTTSTITLCSDNINIYLYYDSIQSTTRTTITQAITLISTSGATLHTISYGEHRLLSKCYLKDSKPMFLIGFNSAKQGSYILVESLLTLDSTGAYVNTNLLAKFSYSYTSGNLVTENCETNLVFDGANKYFLATQFSNRINTETGTVQSIYGIQLNKFTFDITSLYEYSEFGGNTYLAGGILSCYDGAKLFEVGYNYYPETITATPNNTSGYLVAGTRQVVAVYEYYDSKGNLHRSAPSIPVSYDTTGGTSYVTYLVSTLNLTKKFFNTRSTSISIAIYRTQADRSIFYRVTSLTIPLYSTLAINVSFVDGSTSDLSDANIADNEILYTTSGELEAIPPPACKLVTTYKNRLVVAGLENENEVWYSKEYDKDIAPEFHDTFKFSVEEGEGGITGLGVLDDKLILFKKSSMYVLAGSGPDKTGANSDYTIPQRISGDVGCPYPRSIVQYPNGLLFKSMKGWYLLDRTLSTSYLGAAVENSNNLTVTSSTLLADKNEVRITHSDGDAIVYNYLFDSWGRATYKAIDAVEIEGQYYKILNNYLPYQESTGYLDDGTNIKIKVVTPWIAVAGVQGFQRVWKGLILGSYLSNHILRVRIAYDYENFYSDTYEINSDTIISSSSYYGSSSDYGDSTTFGENQTLLEQFEIKPTRQKCMAIRFEITDLNPTKVNNAGLSLNRLDLEIGVKQGNNKVSNNRTIQSV